VRTVKALFNRFKTWLFRLFYRYANRKAWRDHLDDTVAISQLQIQGPEGVLATRMYHGRADRPLVIYFHGGGWVIGDLDTHDPYCRALSAASGCTVMSIDYRLAPEHPFPAAHDDCLAATRWILEHLDTLAPNNGQVVLAGDSAGGNLTACTALMLEGEPKLAGCLMLYPAIQHYHSDLPSYREHAKTGPLTTPIMRWFIDTYLGETAAADPATERLFPGRRQSFRAFPRSLLVTAERDPLRDDGRRLALRLSKDGVNVEHHHFDEEAHGFACSEGPTPGFNRCLQLSSEWLISVSQP
jgi:acetyl esterase